MFGILRAIATVVSPALFAISVAGAQASAPTVTPSPRTAGAAGSAATDRCSTASRIGALDEHERIAVLCVDSLDLSAIHDLTDLLSSRIPGVLVQETSGTPGTAARIRIRGPASIVLESALVVVLDGVRVMGMPAHTSLLAPQLPSRLDDIDINDIATIEVLRGPATSALYGAGAAGGVIRIATKRGALGPPRVRAFSGAGAVIEPTQYPSNYSRPGTYPSTGGPTLNCTLDESARGRCTTTGSAVLSFNPLEQVSQFRRGVRQAHGASISGAAERLGYHAAAGYTSEQGVLDDSDLARRNFRLNLDARPIDALRIALSSAYLSGEAHFPKGDDNYRSILKNGLLGNSQDDPVNRGYRESPDSLRTLENRQDVSRLDAGVSARWTPSSWLEIAAGIGLNEIDTDELELLPRNSDPWPVIRRTGTLRLDRETAGASVAASYPVAGWMRGNTRVGFERNKTDFDQSSGAGDSLVRSSSRRWFDLTTESIYVHQRLGWLDRVELDASLRSDDFDIGYSDGPSRSSHSLALSWLARRKPAAGAAIGSLRLHVAYGNVPAIVSSVDLPIGILPLFSRSGPWELERTAELEGGVVSSLLHDRVHLSLTAYRKVTKDALSWGIDSYTRRLMVANDAKLRNMGVEGSARAVVVATRPLDVGLEIGMWTSSSEVVSLRGGGWSYPEYGAGQRHAEGYPLGGFWHRRILSWEDINGDGTISRVNCPGQPQVAGGPACEIEVGTEHEYLGSPTPRLELFFAPKLTLFDRIHVSALLDHRSGFKQNNQTEALRCYAGRCRAASDASAPLADQARAIAGRMGAWGGYVEDATFTKLREVAASISVPEAWMGALGGRSASFTLAGRHLATWTAYSGLDPEITGWGPLGFSQAETFTQPPLRHYTARLSVGW